MDFAAMKGFEYLLVIGFLVLMVLYFHYALVPAPATRTSPVRAGMRRLGAEIAAWFEVPENFYFHRGHTWAFPEQNDVYRVGMDDFANRLIGPADRLELPSPGEALEPGEPAWRVHVDGQSIDLLAPLQGEVVEVNPLVLSDPGLLSADPYGDGWLLKVRAARAGSVLKNLLTAGLASSWMEDSIRRLNRWMGQDLGVVLQDGGLPVHGFARQLAGEKWAEMASELLLTEKHP